jgi:signal transduction histidine kinase
LQVQVEIQESTYRHIAKEIHDNVGQLLSTTKMLIGIAELKLGQAPDTLQTASATLSKAIQELRMLSVPLIRNG